ncbi:MAG: DUF6359 domain-containing protein [Alloprevotella sp.]
MQQSLSRSLSLLGRLLIVVGLGLGLPTSCEKSLLIDDESNEEDTDNGKNETPEEVGDTLTVAELLQTEPGNVVVVKGYIVGYLASTSFSSAVFGLPTETANTNFIMADLMDETDPNRCIAVKLKAGDERDALNLLEHPEYLHEYVAVRGLCETYFRRNGITEILDMESIEAPQSFTVPTPTLQHEPCLIVDGR